MGPSSGLKRLSATQVHKVAALLGKELVQAEAKAAKPASGKKRAAESSPAPAPDKKAKAQKAPEPPAPRPAKAAPAPQPAAKAAKAAPSKASPTPAKKPADDKPSVKRSAGKKGKEAAGEEVRSVERITDVRVSKAGDAEFRIKWKGLGDRESSWEPEDHILDDSLIDEYMKNRLVKMAPAGGVYAVGTAVDVLGEADGFEYSWAPAKVLKAGKSGKYDVEYLDFMDGKSKLVEKGVELPRLRPMQPKMASSKWKPALGELIEAFDDDCWWEGKMLGFDKKKSDHVLVMLRLNDEKKAYARKDVRPSCWWSAK